MAEHREQQDNDRQRQGPPEAPAEVDQLRILAVVQARHHRFQRHAAKRARARCIAHDFWMHRAGVLRAGGYSFHVGRSGGREVARGIGDELAAAACRAEMEVLPFVPRLVRRVR